MSGWMPVLNVDKETIWWMSWWMPVLNVDIETIWWMSFMNACIECRYRNYDEWVDECFYWMYT